MPSGNWEIPRREHPLESGIVEFRQLEEAAICVAAHGPVTEP
jgi:hypothetical protein